MWICVCVCVLNFAPFHTHSHKMLRAFGTKNAICTTMYNVETSYVSVNMNAFKKERYTLTPTKLSYELRQQKRSRDGDRDIERKKTIHNSDVYSLKCSHTQKWSTISNWVFQIFCLLLTVYLLSFGIIRFGSITTCQAKLQIVYFIMCVTFYILFLEQNAFETCMHPNIILKSKC